MHIITAHVAVGSLLLATALALALYANRLLTGPVAGPSEAGSLAQPASKTPASAKLEATA
jgi:hypothetical protein